MPPVNTFCKEERICGKVAVGTLMKTGKWGATAHYKYCWAVSEEGKPCRILVSVPKKCFRRAVKRNLLKRRTRESYRLNKGILEGRSLDIMFVYTSPEVAESAELRDEVVSILERVSR